MLLDQTLVALSQLDEVAGQRYDTECGGVNQAKLAALQAQLAAAPPAVVTVTRQAPAATASAGSGYEGGGEEAEHEHEGGEGD